MCTAAEKASPVAVWGGCPKYSSINNGIRFAYSFTPLSLKRNYRQFLFFTRSLPRNPLSSMMGLAAIQLRVGIEFRTDNVIEEEAIGRRETMGRTGREADADVHAVIELSKWRWASCPK